MKTYMIDTEDNQRFIVIASDERTAEAYVGGQTAAPIESLRELNTPQIFCLGELE